MAALNLKPKSSTIEVLAPIWQQVLQLSEVGIDDNFFDLGGDSSSALELFNAIARACGRELPPVMIYQAPTLAALASLIEQRDHPGFPPLVLLKPGSEGPPVFITHGLGGTVIDFYQVLRHIQTPHPIHGMQVRGIDAASAPFDRIEDMAQYYLDAVEELLPQGPYLLIGYSLGGLVTLEMAHRLSAKGKKVALLALLDTYPHVSHLSALQRTQLAWQRMRRYVSKGSTPPAIPLSPTMQRVRDCAYVALQRYRPRFYGGKIRFVKAEISTDFPQDPAAVWSKFAPAIEVETVPGDHLEIMTTHFRKLASVLSRYIEEAS
jgi:thioesterase domain-containing protein/acyl carrier protein